jgi:hypothetical protein
MKTDDLIRALATGFDAARPVPRHSAARRLVPAVAAAAVLAVPLMAWRLGVNPGLADAAGLPMFWVKLGFVLSVLLASAWLTARLSLPGVAPGRAWLALWLPPVLLGALALAVVVAAAPAQRMPLVLGSTWRACPWNIALLSLPALACVLVALRGLAPTRLRVAGAAGGLLAGATGASVYVLHCPELAPPFIAVWYVLGMLLPAAAGALLGPRLLRW